MGRNLVLVVDDDADIIMLCRLLLEAQGFDVITAGDGASALSLVADRAPAVVLLDFMLPDITGLDVVRALRDAEGRPTVPVVILTARSDVKDQQAAWQLGVVDYVIKPFDEDRLLDAVRSAADPGNAPEWERSRTEALDRLRATDVTTWRRLASALEHASDAIITTSLDGTVTSWNRGAEHLCGYTAAEAIGRNVSMLTPAGQVDELVVAIDRTAAGERVDHFEGVCQRRDGELQHVAMSVSPVLEPSGEVSSASIIARDVSERRRGELRFRALVEGAPDAMVIVDSSGYIELINAQSEKLFGYSRDELIGQSIEKLVPERFRTRHPQHRDRYGLAPRVRPMGAGLELQSVRKDGTEFPVEISLSPIETADGMSVAATIRDASERTHALTMFRGLVESAPDAMVIVDADGVIQLINSQTERLFGHERDDLIGQPVEMLVPPRFRSRHREHRLGYVASARVRAMGAGLDLYGLRQDGTEFPVEISLSPIETNEGRVISAAIRDVTERSAAEATRRIALEREQEASQRLRDVDRLRSDFLATVSHELRTPLTTIKGFSRLLGEGGERVPEGDRDHLIERIAVSADRLDHLINDLLDVSRLERGLIKVDPRPTPLRELVTAAIERIEAVIEHHHVAVDIDSELVVLADPMAFPRVLENLLSNAAKFSPAGSNITIDTVVTDSSVDVAVTDCGDGIAPGEIERIFDRFYRVGGEENRTPGTGIGLAIVKEFTEVQGGSVAVRSALGEGTTFIVTMPRG